MVGQFNHNPARLPVCSTIRTGSITRESSKAEGEYIRRPFARLITLTANLGYGVDEVGI